MLLLVVEHVAISQQFSVSAMLWSWQLGFSSSCCSPGHLLIPHVAAHAQMMNDETLLT